MSAPIDREGLFRGTIKEYSLRQHETGTVGIELTVSVDDWWNGANWEDWRPYDFEARGEVFVIKKNGATNVTAVESFVDASGWDGTFASVNNQTWVPNPIGFSIKMDEYQGKTKFRINYIFGFNSSPTPGRKRVAVDAVALDSRFGASLRAIVGSRSMNRPTPSNPLPPPPVRQPLPDAVPF